MDERDDYYWSVDFQGLSELQAEALLEFAETALGIRGTAVDPEHWLTRHLDDATVRSIVRVLESADVDDRAEMSDIREDFTAWLRRASGT